MGITNDVKAFVLSTKNDTEKTYHQKKLELFKEGVQTGKLHWNTVVKRLASPSFTRMEKYRFQFSCHHMNIELIKE